jgi:hypothetical protein
MDTWDGVRRCAVEPWAAARGSSAAKRLPLTMGNPHMASCVRLVLERRSSDLGTAWDAVAELAGPSIVSWRRRWDGHQLRVFGGDAGPGAGRTEGTLGRARFCSACPVSDDRDRAAGAYRGRKGRRGQGHRIRGSRTAAAPCNTPRRASSARILTAAHRARGTAALAALANKAADSLIKILSTDMGPAANRIPRPPVQVAPAQGTR